MKSRIEGVIVASNVEPIGDTGLVEGTITIKRLDGELVKIDVSSFTSFTTIDEGEVVTVDVEKYGFTQTLYARNIIVTKNPTLS